MCSRSCRSRRTAGACSTLSSRTASIECAGLVNYSQPLSGGVQQAWMVLALGQLEAIPSRPSGRGLGSTFQMCEFLRNCHVQAGRRRVFLLLAPPGKLPAVFEALGEVFVLQTLQAFRTPGCPTCGFMGFKPMEPSLPSEL